MLSDHLDAVLDDIRNMLLSKNKDYGDGNLKRFGETGIIIRCNDKIERLWNIAQSKENAVGESAEKEWLDIAGYAVQAIRLIREKQNCGMDLRTFRDT